MKKHYCLLTMFFMILLLINSSYINMYTINAPNVNEKNNAYRKGIYLIDCSNDTATGWVTIIQDDFSELNSNVWTFKGSTTPNLADGMIYLISDIADSSIALMYKKDFNYDDFEIILTFSIQEGSQGLDGGLTVAFYKEDFTPRNDYTLGFWDGQNKAPGFGIEIDLESNTEVNDPPSPHIAIISNTTAEHIVYYNLDKNLILGKHVLRIRVFLNTISVFLDGNPIIGTYLNLKKFGSIFSVTASTGDDGGIYAIDSIIVRSRIIGKFAEFFNEDFEDSAKVNTWTNYGKIEISNGELTLVPTSDNISSLAISEGLNIDMIRSFLESQFVPEAKLLRAATVALPDNETIWISSDNLLAGYALKVLESPLSKEVIRKIQEEYNNAYDLKHEVLLGVSIPDIPRAANVYVLSEVYSEKFGKNLTIKVEVCNGSEITDYTEYADLIAYEGINKLIKGDLSGSENLFKELMNMWDGFGFNDTVTQTSKKYAVFKLALAVFLYRALKSAYSKVVDNYADIIDKCISIIVKAQREDGGICTDYYVDNNQIVITGDANTETTSIVVLSLLSEIPVAVGRSIVSVLWLPYEVYNDVAIEVRFRVEQIVSNIGEGLTIMFYKNKDYTPAPGKYLGFTSEDGYSAGYGIEFDYTFSEGFDKYNREVAFLFNTANNIEDIPFEYYEALNGNWSFDHTVSLPENFDCIDEGDFEYVTARIIIDETLIGYEIYVFLNSSSHHNTLIMYLKNSSIEKIGGYIGISASTGSSIMRLKIDYIKVWTRDVKPPSIDILEAPPYYTNKTNIKVVWSATDDSGIDHYEVKIDNQEWINVGNATSYTMEVQEGFHTFIIKAYDKAGNYNEKKIEFIVDTTPPKISDVKYSLTKNGSSEYVIITATILESGNLSVTKVVFTDLLSRKCIEVNMTKISGDLWYAIIKSPPIMFEFYVKAIDKAGNESISNKFYYVKTEFALVTLIAVLAPVISIIYIKKIRGKS